MNPHTFAMQTANVMTWWSSLPTEQRRSIYRPHDITTATSVPTQALPPVLHVLGWNARRVWVRRNGKRKIRTYYAPPGHTVPTPPRGRPSTFAIIAPLIGQPDPYDLYPR